MRDENKLVDIFFDFQKFEKISLSWSKALFELSKSASAVQNFGKFLFEIFFSFLRFFVQLLCLLF